MEDFVYAKMNNSASKIAEFCFQLADFIKKTVDFCKKNGFFLRNSNNCSTFAVRNGQMTICKIGKSCTTSSL